MVIRAIVIASAIILSSCVSDQDACGGDWSCIAQRQAQRDRFTAIAISQSQNRQPLLFYAAPPIMSGGSTARLQTTCYAMAGQLHCN